MENKKTDYKFDWDKYVEWRKELTFKQKIGITYRNTMFIELPIIMIVQMIICKLMLIYNFQSNLIWITLFLLYFLYFPLRYLKYRIKEIPSYYLMDNKIG